MINNKIVTPCFDYLAIRQSPYTKDTSSIHWYAAGFKGKDVYKKFINLKNEQNAYFC